nr:RNA-directed DNA polymerase, eukaryota, reverse transcriptase zinc-binding domain protein [Tanacetum cinerariifolium]
MVGGVGGWGSWFVAMVGGNDDLERDVSNEEIKRTVWDCGIDKAPGQDGFTFGLYRRYWDIIGNDVVDAVKCLIWSLYKVIAKVLANLLVTVLDDIVDEIQYAFVTDRQILDGPFILNEIVHWCKNKKKQSMIFKVDFEKAYDSVRFDFIDDILRRFRFREKWYAIPIYHMSIFKVPIKVLQNMKSIRACFFNGADVNSKKPRWVRRKSVLAAKDVGGLGNSLWIGVVKALHGEDGKIGKKVQPSFITPKLGNGVNTLFWDVAWCRDIAFKNLVPRLYALESMKNIEVPSKLLHGVSSGDFSVSSVRKFIANAILPKGISKTRWIKEKKNTIDIVVKRLPQKQQLNAVAGQTTPVD